MDGKMDGDAPPASERKPLLEAYTTDYPAYPPVPTGASASGPATGYPAPSGHGAPGGYPAPPGEAGYAHMPPEQQYASQMAYRDTPEGSTLIMVYRPLARGVPGTCPCCNKVGTPEPHLAAGTCTWLLAIGMFFCFWPLACTPFCCDGTKDTAFLCPHCKVELYRVRRRNCL